MEKSQCWGCRATIFWCMMPSGKWMPLDETPHPQGNIAVINGQEEGVIVKPGAKLDDGVSLYKTHYATCSYAARFRRPRS